MISGGLVKAVKDIGKLFLRNPFSVVFHLQDGVLSFLTHGDGDDTARGCMFDGIAQQVEKDALHQPHIGLHRQAVFPLKAELAVGPLKAGHPFLRGGGEVKADHFQTHISAFNLSEIQNVINQLP